MWWCRSENAAFSASVIRWRYSTLLWPSALTSYPSRIFSAIGSVGPCDHGPQP